MTVRKAEPTDVEAIRSIAEASWNEDYPYILSRESIEQGFDEWYSTDRLQTELTDPKSLVLVADEEGQTKGFLHAIVDGTDGVILRLYVHPEHRRQGVGRDLFTHARAELQSYDVDNIRAMVLAENTLGSQFYRELGFEKVSEGVTTIGDERYDEEVYELQTV